MLLDSSLNLLDMYNTPRDGKSALITQYLIGLQYIDYWSLDLGLLAAESIRTVLAALLATSNTDKYTRLENCS